LMPTSFSISSSSLFRWSRSRRSDFAGRAIIRIPS
jgi:hypothetical protein